MTSKLFGLDKLFSRTDIRCDAVCVAGHVVGPRYRTQCYGCLKVARDAAAAARVPRRIMTPEERKERRRENLRRWRANNPERLRFLINGWRSRNPAYRKNMKLRRRVAQSGGVSTVTVAQLRERYGKKCAVCHARGRTTV